MGIGAGSQKTKATVQIDVRLIGTASGDILATAKAVGEADQSDSNISVRGISSNFGSLCRASGAGRRRHEPYLCQDLPH